MDLIVRHTCVADGAADPYAWSDSAGAAPCAEQPAEHHPSTHPSRSLARPCHHPWYANERPGFSLIYKSASLKPPMPSFLSCCLSTGKLFPLSRLRACGKRADLLASHNEIVLCCPGRSQRLPRDNRTDTLAAQQAALDLLSALKCPFRCITAQRHALCLIRSSPGSEYTIPLEMP